MIISNYKKIISVVALSCILVALYLTARNSYADSYITTLYFGNGITYEYEELYWGNFSNYTTTVTTTGTSEGDTATLVYDLTTMVDGYGCTYSDYKNIGAERMLAGCFTISECTYDPVDIEGFTVNRNRKLEARRSYSYSDDYSKIIVTYTLGQKSQ